MPGDSKERKKLPPLDIKCTRSDCENDLHCFKKTRKMTLDQVGQCRSCGAKLVDWERIRSRDLTDVEFTFQALRREWIRHHFWHTPIDEAAQFHARRKGRLKLHEAAEKRLRSSVGRAQPYRDGQQTPMSGGNILYYAQHALACCCRTCMEYWHGIQKGEELTPEQVAYFAELVMMFANERLPKLTEEGEKIPHRRRAHTSNQGDGEVPHYGDAAD